MAQWEGRPGAVRSNPTSWRTGPQEKLYTQDFWLRYHECPGLHKGNNGTPAGNHLLLRAVLPLSLFIDVYCLLMLHDSLSTSGSLDLACSPNIICWSSTWFRSGAFGKQLDHEGSDIIDGLIHRWVLGIELRSTGFDKRYHLPILLASFLFKLSSLCIFSQQWNADSHILPGCS